MPKNMPVSQKPRKERKIIVTSKRGLNPAEILELQELQRVVNFWVYTYKQVQANTALVPRGQEIAKETEAMARLLDNTKNQWVANKLLECGYPQGIRCDINLTTGQIIETKTDESTNDKKS